jgi:hypothetical protein
MPIVLFASIVEVLDRKMFQAVSSLAGWPSKNDLGGKKIENHIIAALAKCCTRDAVEWMPC